MANVKLNADIYTHLLSFVSSPSDLLAVGLANKELLTLAEPELIYRSIRCKLNNDAVWEHLISKPLQASRVRELVIQREASIPRSNSLGQERIPEGNSVQLGEPSGQVVLDPRQSKYGRKNAENSERLLLRALQKMVNLDSFTWDRWMPFINQGEEVFHYSEEEGIPPVYREDIWTALRDYTQVKILEVVDFGKALFPESRPIFNSTIFTLRNLTRLDLRIYYSPDDEFEGARGFDDDDDNEDLIPGRVKIERLQDLLSRCSNLESLSLAIMDRVFYHNLDGNPFTNITPIISNAHWPRLTSLKLEDILIDDGPMANFLRLHPNLRVLSACLSLIRDNLPDVPFNLESYESCILDILPRLEHLSLPSQAIRPILRAMRRPCSLQSIAHLEPHDWYSDDDDNIVSSLDDVWGSSTESFTDIEDGPLHGRDFPNLLFGMPDLNKLVVRDVMDLRQLDKLVKSTPTLQYITFEGSFMKTQSNDMHTQLLPYLSGWTKLLSCTGGCLWPLDETLELSSPGALSVAREILQACPLLRELSWRNCRPVKLMLKDNGELIKLEQDPHFNHSNNYD
ncbi:hypothetical protein GALMADRAFT_80837 [Galerina marginata CBS 339.88]|uniref:F-box domain-containing protein n=1 Tax=Galerina marginata (strain CBS 339.88) TaxID=685588 RepID=A0A067S6G3_GALM3|nr:hypothetical protein GALMADRAFT_80837 [Galerina marginata CBS 339.88]